jgi:hypothetical protein
MWNKHEDVRFMTAEIIYQLAKKVNVNEVRAEVTQLAQQSGVRQNVVDLALKRLDKVQGSPKKGSP